VAFIVEDGSGVPGANSYLSLDDADAYHTDRGNTAWQTTADKKKAALIKATAYVENRFVWETGYKADSLNSLSWPRYEAEDAEGYGFDGDEIPEKLKAAVAELALVALSEDIFSPIEREISSVSAGPVSVSYVPGASQEKRYPLVEGLLRGLASPSSSSSGVSFPSVVRG
jgi:hypothetical protein